MLPSPRDPVAAPPRKRLLADLTPLRTSADFRRLWIGNTISWVGQGMTALAISLQVYDLTRSSFSVGLVGLFSLVPLVVFGLYGGAIADTVDRRLLGLASSTGSWLLAVALAVAAFAGFHQVWFLYAVVALQAVCAALNSPARTSMIPRLLPAEQLPAANALNSMTTTFGTMTGPMLGGALVGLWGYQAAYLIDAVAFTAALYAMWRLPAMRPQREEGSRGRASVLDGLRFLATRPNIRMTFFTDLCAMVLAHPRALFPAVAVVWYGGDAKTAGLLVAAPAVGALLGSVFSGWLGRVHRHGVAILLAVGGWGLAVAVFGLTRNLWLGLLFLALAGAADAISMVFRSTMLQAATPDAMRGRLQGVFIVVVAGGPRLGDFLAGSVGDLASPTVAVTGGGLLCVLAVTALGLRWRNFARYDARDPQP
ncbi:MFS transporter [Streptomyces albidoflavus]|nr:MULTISPECIES: MFS transporter [Streptomyces]QLA60810.1 MFS transporter [Streptomyces violascens]MBK3381434.1 MFS transporter [Streptomyces sp. DEF147AK]MBK3386452.1 MFS transporter [Streptomyces sp. DEF1AK]MBO1285847.1 MFS transporter [Streptomyces sampsonii]MBV7254044.1 MFS transporter [Streptomyces sp. S-2]